MPNMGPAEMASALETLRQEVRQLKELSQQAFEPQPPEPDLFLPERFTGSRTEYIPFKLDCELLFILKPRTYAKDFVKVRTAIFCLSGRIKSWAHQLLLTKDPVLLSWDSFIKAMDAWMGRQQPRSKVRSSTALRESKLFREEPFRSGTSVPTIPSVLHDSGLVSPQEEPPEEVQVMSADEEEPMELSLGTVWTYPSEQARRRALGLCFYCGASGHFISHCVRRPPRTVPSPPAYHRPVPVSRPEIRHVRHQCPRPCLRPQNYPSTEIRSPAKLICGSILISDPPIQTPVSEPVAISKPEPVVSSQTLEAVATTQPKEMQPGEVSPSLPDTGTPEVLGEDDPNGRKKVPGRALEPVATTPSKREEFREFALSELTQADARLLETIRVDDSDGEEDPSLLTFASDGVVIRKSDVDLYEATLARYLERTGKKSRHLPDAEFFGVDDPYGDEQPVPMLTASDGTIIPVSEAEDYETALWKRLRESQKKLSSEKIGKKKNKHRR